MSFFDKYAKLKSEVEESGDSFTINVYDDEISLEKPIMWLNADVADFEEYEPPSLDEDETYDFIMNYRNKFRYVVYVRIVNTNSSIYFELPEQRRNTAATSLFKRFIKYYRENYDGELVAADFANYDLQEKFKTAVEKGIFPEESMLASEFTTKEDYENSPYFNIENKEKIYNKIKSIVGELQNIGLNVYPDNNTVIAENVSISKLIESIKSVTEETMGNMISGRIEQNGNYIFYLPLEHLDNPNLNFYYETISNTVVLLDYLDDEWLNSFVKENESKFREIFDIATDIFTESDGISMPIDQFFNTQTHNAFIKVKRLLKKG